MRRIGIAERPNWRKSAEESGFAYHSIGGVPYWDETAYYAFTLRQIENDLEDASAEMHALAMEVVDRAVNDENVLTRLAIPQASWDTIRTSYRRGDPTLYGRFDFAYDGSGPAKLLEYNADTPTSLYEASCFQWSWLEELIANGALPSGTDQFNSIHDKLIAVIREIAQGRKVHTTCLQDAEEDLGTVSYIGDCAALAGLETAYVPVEDIGLLQNGYFCDGAGEAILLLFKLYPWEWMMRDEYGAHLLKTGTAFMEPPWKTVLSNKGLLPLMWDLAPGHPNLLPAFFEDDPRKWELGKTFAKKPLYSREGANVTLVSGSTVIDSAGGKYGSEGHIRQALATIPCFDGNYPVIGSWIVGGEPAGIGIREDITPITKNDSRFLPHIILA